MAEKNISMTETTEVLYEVKQEREKQQQKWGEQNHNPVEWIAILTEEVGEASKEALDHHFCNPVKLIDHKGSEPRKMVSEATESDQLQRLKDYRAELIQVAAVATQMVESLDRNELKAEKKDGQA